MWSRNWRYRSWLKGLIFFFFFYLDLIGAGLEGVHSGNLLKSIETDDDEAVVEFGRRRFLAIDLVQEEAIQRQRLFVNDVAPGW